jgi:hypothetical protein
MSTLFCQTIEQQTQAAPERRQSGEWQQMQQPEQDDSEAAQHCLRSVQGFACIEYCGVAFGRIMLK